MIYGIYNAVVLDNTSYFSTGFILCRLFNWYGASRTDKDGKHVSIDDLSTNPDMINEGNYITPDGQSATGPTQDFNCRILSPIGGGKNYGMFHLPQVNEKGVVSFLDNDFYKPIWMGSYFEPLIDTSQAPNYVVQQIPVPNDDITGARYNRGYSPSNKEQPTIDPNAIVIRTKHTTLEPQGSSYDASKIDWSKQDGENLILIGSNEVRIRHYNDIKQGKLNSYQEILMNRSPTPTGDSDPQITMVVNDVQNNKQTVVRQDEDSFTITTIGSKGTFQFAVTSGDTGINIIDQFGNKITANKSGIKVDSTSNSNSTITMTGSQINIGDPNTLANSARKGDQTKLDLITDPTNVQFLITVCAMFGLVIIPPILGAISEGSPTVKVGGIES